MNISRDICLDDGAFTTASDEMAALKIRTETLKSKLESMYRDLTTALNTPAGEKLKVTAKDVLIKPIEDMYVVIQHTSETLKTIIGSENYKDIFTKFDALQESVKF